MQFKFTVSLAGHPEEAEKILNDLKLAGATLGTLPYSSVIAAYLKNRDYNIAIQKLMVIKTEGLEPDTGYGLALYELPVCETAMQKPESFSLPLQMLDLISQSGFCKPIQNQCCRRWITILEPYHH